MNRNSIEMNVNGIDVMISPDVKAPAPVLRSIAEHFIKDRSCRNIIVYPYEGKHAIRFANVKEQAAVGVPAIRVATRTGYGLIVPMYGLTAGDITDDDKRYAARLWDETVCIEARDDGTPYIDD